MYEFTTAYPNGLPDEKWWGGGSWWYKKPFSPRNDVSSIPDPAMMKQMRIDSAMYPVKRLFKDFILNA